MIPSNFEESNIALQPPAGKTVDEVEPLFAFQGVAEGGAKVVISCWKPTVEELEEIRRTGRVWLTVMGQTAPPAFLSGFSPFGGGE